MFGEKLGFSQNGTNKSAIIDDKFRYRSPLGKKHIKLNGVDSGNGFPIDSYCGLIYYYHSCTHSGQVVCE